MSPRREVRGHLLTREPAPRTVSAAALLSGPVPVGGDGRGRLHPAIAVLLREPLTRDAGPGAVTRAIGAVFAAAHLVDPVDGDRFVLGDRAIEVPLRGPITVCSDRDLPDTYLPEDFGDLGDRLVGLADLVGGLSAGEVAVLGPLAGGVGVPARPGTVQLWGPRDSLLILRLVEPTAPGQGRRS